MEIDVGFKGLMVAFLVLFLIFVILVTALPVVWADALFGLWILIGLVSLSYGIIAPVMVITWVLTGFHHVSNKIKNTLRALVFLPLFIADIIGIMNSWSYYWEDPWSRMFLVGFAWIRGFRELLTYIR